MARSHAIATPPGEDTLIVPYTAAEEAARDAEEANWDTETIKRTLPSIEEEVQRRVRLVVPERELLNQVAEAVELLDKEKANWDAADIARAATLRTNRTKIAAVRAAGKALATSLEAKTPVQIRAINVRAQKHWPTR